MYNNNVALPLNRQPLKSKQVCAGAILMKDNQFLFGKRNKRKKWAPGVWDIVGGRSLPNENPLYTLQRETFEETGVMIRDAVLLDTLHIPEDRPGRSFEYFIYMVTHYKGRVTLCSDEHTKLKWFTREELNEMTIAIPEYLILIDRWLNESK